MTVRPPFRLSSNHEWSSQGLLYYLYLFGKSSAASSFGDHKPERFMSSVWLYQHCHYRCGTSEFYDMIHIGATDRNILSSPPCKSSSSCTSYKYLESNIDQHVIHLQHRADDAGDTGLPSGSRYQRTDVEPPTFNMARHSSPAAAL